MKTCTDCGGDVGKGWTDDEEHERCAACEVAGALIGRRHRSAVHRTIGTCACGCGRVGALVGFGLINRCYLRLRTAGALTRWREAHDGR